MTGNISVKRCGCKRMNVCKSSFVVLQRPNLLSFLATKKIWMGVMKEGKEYVDGVVLIIQVFYDYGI